MNNNYLLDKVLNLGKWQDVQDSIAEMTKLAIVTVDYKGDTVTEHSRCNNFCKIVRNNPELSQLCKKCDSRGGLEAVRTNGIYIYLCHFDLVDIAIPITINNNYAGAILAGQVRLKNEKKLEKIVSLPPDFIETMDNELQSAYEELPILSYEDVLLSTDMLGKICNYIIEESISKNQLIEIYEKLRDFDNMKSDNNDLQKSGTLADMKSKLINAINNCNVSSDNNEQVRSVTLRPAVEYIRSHLSEDITITKLSTICSVSSGYLSRLFVQETGETFTNYHNRLRIEAACNMLLNTDYSITQISDALGYSDPSYFNRVFKKVRNLTPGLFRKFNK